MEAAALYNGRIIAPFSVEKMSDASVRSKNCPGSNFSPLSQSSLPITPQSARSARSARPQQDNNDDDEGYDYTPVGSPVAESSPNENINERSPNVGDSPKSYQCETAADIEKFERNTKYKQQKKKNFAQRKLDKLQELTEKKEREEHAQEEEKRRVEEYRQKLKAKIVERVVVKRETGFVSRVDDSSVTSSTGRTTTSNKRFKRQSKVSNNNN